MRRGLLALFGVLLLSSAGRAQVKPCCTITALDARSDTATARENATSRVFVFKVSDARLFASLRVGQGVYANFTSHQVSIDGKSACCVILSITPPPSSAPQSAPAPAAPRSAPTPSPQTGSVPSGTPSPSSGSVPQNAGRPDAARTPIPPAQNTSGKKPGVLGALPAGASGTKPNSFTIPPVSYGAPQSAQSSGVPSTGLRDSRGRGSMNPNVVRLHGINGIATATGIPQAAKDFLMMHARTLPAGEVDNYVVNAQLAEEWFRTHPEPESVKKAAAKSDSHAGCTAISVHCAGEAAQHAADEAARQSQKLLEEAQAEWNHVTGEVERDWNMVQGCFVDNRLTLPGIPVKFSLTPEFPMNFHTNGTASNQYGSASGTINGSVVFGVPIQSDFTAQVDMFYIPCLPFAVRPRSIAASGKLGVGSTFDASATATGKFNQTFTIPPTGGPHFPIEVIPIVIAGVPVAELDVSVYVDGRVLVDGEGKVGGAVSVKTMQDTVFDFACSGKACDLNQRSVPEPVSTAESVRIDGRIHVKPEVYAALQLDFDVDLLTARAGPQPYLLGEIYGCATASGTQSAGQPTSGQESYTLTSDLDWGIELRAEALVAEKKVAEKDWKLLQRHLYFKDLANSTALIPVLSGAAQPSPGQPAVYTVKMPACYPYSDPVEYGISWTGGAVGASASVPDSSSTVGRLPDVSERKLAGKPASQTTGSTSSSCTLQPALGQCWSDPAKNASVGLVWPSVGSFVVTATPLRDQHGRKFDPARTAQVSVNVQQAGVNSPAGAPSQGQASPDGSSSASASATPQSQQTSQQPSPSSTSNKNKPGTNKRTDAGKDTLGTDGTVVAPGAEPTTEQAVRAATAANPPAQTKGAVVARYNPQVVLPVPNLTLNVPDPNPNHLPNLAAGSSGGLAECSYYPPQTCQSACGSIITTKYIGVKNITAYPVNGTIEVLLQDTSGNTVRRWTVGGLAGNGEAYPGRIRIPFKCVTPGTETLNADTPNYVLLVNAPFGVTELDLNDNRMELYIDPTWTIAP